LVHLDNGEFLAALTILCTRARQLRQSCQTSRLLEMGVSLEFIVIIQACLTLHAMTKLKAQSFGGG
jgi:hypothetical protein